MAKSMCKPCVVCRFCSRHGVAIVVGLIALLCLLAIASRLRKINKTLEKIAGKMGPDHPQPPTGTP
jgi:hypothetical protein